MTIPLPNSLVFGTLVLAALAVLCGDARAESQNPEAAPQANSPLTRYLLAYQQFQAMDGAAVELDRRLGIGCDQPYNIALKGLFIEQPIDLPDGATDPDAGVWTYRFDAIRCGGTKRYNLVMTAQPNARPRVGLLPPGDTRASVALEKDLIPALAVRARADLGKACADLTIGDVRVTQMPHEVTSGGRKIEGVWIELWTVQGCGKQTPYKVTFIPDTNGDGGTTYVVDPLPAAP